MCPIPDLGFEQRGLKKTDFWTHWKIIDPGLIRVNFENFGLWDHARVKTGNIADSGSIRVNFENFGLWGHARVKTENIHDPGPIRVNFENFWQWGLARVKAENIYIQDELPIHKSAFERNEQALQRAHNRKKNDEKQKAYYNSSARELPELQPGEHIAMYNPNKKIWDTYGKITKLINKRRYEIKLNNGAILQRNRKYLRTRHPASTLEHRKPDNNITIRKSIRDKKPTKRLIEND